MKIVSKKHLNIETLKANVEYPAVHWLKPCGVATLIGLDVKWLAAAREGRKGVEGPPYRKIGDAQTSPIRYDLDELIKWMNSFPLQYSTTNNYNSFNSYIDNAAVSELWPCVIDNDGNIVELFTSMNSSKFRNHYIDRKIVWLSKIFVPHVIKYS